LFTVLWDNQSPAAIDGWLGLPWNNAQNAIGLLLDWHRAVVMSAELTADEETVVSFLDVVTRLSTAAAVDSNGSLYWTSKTLADNLRAVPGVSARCLAEGLEMAQRFLAFSDGGGALYNDHLRAAYDLVSSQFEVNAKATVLKRRMDDVVPDPHDLRRRKAFVIAWERGLFKLAYLV
jgi:hypothetical protein